MSKLKDNVCIICTGPGERFKNKICTPCANVWLRADITSVYARKEFCGYKDNLYGIVRYVDNLDDSLSLADNNPIIRYIAQFKKERQSSD